MLPLLVRLQSSLKGQIELVFDHPFSFGKCRTGGAQEERTAVRRSTGSLRHSGISSSSARGKRGLYSILRKLSVMRSFQRLTKEDLKRVSHLKRSAQKPERDVASWRLVQHFDSSTDVVGLQR